MKVTFIRHGYSESNQSNILSSNISDEFYLTKIGESELEDTARKFQPKSDEKVYVYCSPMKRTIHSAEVYLKYSKINCPINLDKRIKEINYGDYSGKENIGYIHEKIKDVYEKMSDGGDYLIRLGETGENNREFLLRNYQFLLDVINRHGAEEKCHIIIFSHAGPIRAMENVILNNYEHRPRIHNGEFHAYDIPGELTSYIEGEIKRIDGLVCAKVKDDPCDTVS